MSGIMFFWPSWLLLTFAGINFALCCVIGWSCICRFSVMSKDTVVWHWRLRYILVLVGATASGFSWTWGEWPGPGQILMACACLYVIGITAKGWRDGPPAYAQRVQTQGAQ